MAAADRIGSLAVLPDYLAPGLDIVFCGTAVAATSARQGHYYAGPGNEFWPLLLAAGLTPTPRTPEDDYRVLDNKLGLTDLAKDIVASSDRGLASHYDVEGFIGRIAQYRPRWVAFNGKEAGKEVADHLGHGRSFRLGRQPWKIAASHVFVLPSTSASNCNPAFLEGADSKLEWFQRLAAVVKPDRG